MGNRALITLDFKGPKSYYCHWNGGGDTVYPMVEAMTEILKTHYIEKEDIQAAFLEFSGGTKLELIDYPARNLVEENGHYFIKLDENGLFYIVRRYEIRNDLTDCYDILSERVTPNKAAYEKYCLDTFTVDAVEKCLSEYDERVNIFLEAFKKICKPHPSFPQVSEKATFKKLILDELKALGRKDIVSKIKSIKSDGGSVNVSALNLFKEQREFLENILNEYKDGYFDGMTDCYNYSKVKTRPKTARYAFLNNEFSTELKEEVKEALLKEYGDEKALRDALNIDIHTAIWRKLCEK